MNLHPPGRPVSGPRRILVAGGTGRLGAHVVRVLSTQGLEVRVLARDLARAEGLGNDHVEVVRGDVRNPRTLGPAMVGITTVISAISGFSGAGGSKPSTVDWQGNRNLIQTARSQGIEHFILVSIAGAAPDHPVGLYRMKYRAEQTLRSSGLAWTIIRPTISMETFVTLVGEPLLKKGKTRIFGRGTNPINFVSTHDVARFVELSVVDPKMRGVTVEVDGPENLSLGQLVQVFERVTGKTGATRHVPLPMMRLMAVLMRPVKPALAGMIQAMVMMDTTDMSFDASDARRRYPSIPQTTLTEVIARDYLVATLAPR